MAIGSKLYFSEDELLERWGMSARDSDVNNRFLRHLREKRLLPFVRLSKTHIVYPVAAVQKYEEARLVPDGDSELLDDALPEPRKRGRPPKDKGEPHLLLRRWSTVPAGSADPRIVLHCLLLRPRPLRRVGARVLKVGKEVVDQWTLLKGGGHE